MKMNITNAIRSSTSTERRSAGGAVMVTVEHKDDIIVFSKFARIMPGLLDEVNAFIASLSESEQDDLFDCYSNIHDTISMGDSVNLNTYKYLLDDVFTEERVKPFCDKIAFPKTSPVSFENDNKHYTRAETYTISQYEDLAILSVRLRALIPIFSLMGLYTNGKSETGGRLMYITKDILDKIECCDIAATEAYDRLWVYVDATKDKIISKGNGVSLTGTILEGIGSIDLPTYLLALSIIHGCVTTSITNKSTNIARVINNKLGDELTKKITKRFSISDQRPFAKMVSAEDNNVGYIETYQSREQVPESIPLMCGVWLEDYRKARKFWDVDLNPKMIKTFIDSVEKYPYPHLTPTHQTLLKLCSMGLILHQTVVDIPEKMLNSLIGISQAYLVENKLHSLARLLSAHGTFIERGGNEFHLGSTIFDKLSKDTEEWLSRYYSLKIPIVERKGQHSTSNWSYGYELTIDNFTTQIVKYTWEQVATPEVAAILCSENTNFVAGRNVAEELGKLIAIVNLNAKRHLLGER